MTEREVAIIWNKEFCLLNHIPYNSREEPIAAKSYYTTIARNNAANGGSAFKLPGTIVPTPPSPSPINPTTPLPSASITNALSAAREVVRQLEAMIPK